MVVPDAVRAALRVDVNEDIDVPETELVDQGVPLAVEVAEADRDGDMERVAHSAPASKLTPHSSGSANVNRYVQSN